MIQNLIHSLENQYSMAANRLLRDWTCSDKVNELSAQAERFFTRLIMKADDYGCFHARTNLLKANLFPLLLDSIREADLLRWLAECQKAGLVVLYEHSGKEYLQIVDFNQRKRIMKRNFPDPTTCGQPADNPLTGGIPEQEVEREVEVEREEEKPGKPGGFDLIFPFDSIEFKAMWDHWKAYKSKDHRFNYKSVQSEQAALNDLTKLAGGKENTALEIIQQSMAKGWKGFFELKQRKNATSGHKPTINSLQEAHARRYGNG